MMKLTTLVRTLASALVMSATLSTTAMASAPFAKTSAPGYFRIMLGDFEVTALNDGTIDLPVDQLLSEKPEDTGKALAKSFLQTPLETSVNAYLINTGTKLVLVDAGAGTLFGPTVGKLLANLKASGYEAAQVDEIYITHFHPDHVGGLAANGVTAFPNAIVRADQRESDFWLSTENMDKAPDATKGFYQGAIASVSPYVAANRYKAFSGTTELVPGITANASVGHTIGHTDYVVESKGQKLVIVGDLLHVAAVQFDKPSITIKFDSDAKAAAEIRKKVFDQATKDGALVAVAHIQFPGLGHIRANGKNYQWVPVNFTQLR